MSGELKSHTSFKEIARGAEAVIEETSWFGRKAVRKHRIPKGYREVALDQELRKARTRAEARLFRDSRKAGFPVPAVFDVDEVEMAITMEFLEGPTAKAEIDRDPEAAQALCTLIGTFIGCLHGARMVHGDLTTSNIMITPNGPVFIDLGLGGKDLGDEALGVDLHLIKEALESTHNHIPGLFEALLEGYRTTFPGAKTIEKKVQDIEKRGRYT